MLVLARKKGQSILIGDDIVVTVGSFSASPVTGKPCEVILAISAPDSVKILRKELLEKKKKTGFPFKRDEEI